MKHKHPNVGSSFESFLKDEGILDEVDEFAAKRVLAWQITREMKRQRLSKSMMATRMRTSRAQLDRLLDPTNPSVTLRTLFRAAATLGKRWRLDLVNAR